MVHKPTVFDGQVREAVEPETKSEMCMFEVGNPDVIINKLMQENARLANKLMVLEARVVHTLALEMALDRLLPPGELDKALAGEPLTPHVRD